MGTGPKSPKPPEAPPLAIKIGDVVLDRYRLIEHIASGGHSVVFRGQDERLSRPVCVKVFSGFGGNSGVGRTSYEHFVQEAFALSRLTHPNTLRIYDFGHLGAKDADGMPLQVCEFMNGGTLSQIIRDQGKQSLAETARIVHAMCLALGEAHGLGIVHRDIKPQNILFGAVGNNKLPKLADFGIAKWSADDDNKEQRAEDTAIVAGQKLAMYSPSWAAPEQLAGQPVSPGTDIYSLACVAVYMLSGKAIFADEDVYAGYRKRRHADQLVREALAPLDIPAPVIELLVNALAFDPKKRLSQVEELASNISGALAPDEPSGPHPNHAGLSSAPKHLPDAMAPHAGQPHAGQPHAGQPHAGQPHAGQPHAGQPHAGQPHAGQPHAGQPHAGQPHAGQPHAGQPHAGQPHAGPSFPSQQAGQSGPHPGQPRAVQPHAAQPFPPPHAAQPYPSPQAAPAFPSPQAGQPHGGPSPAAQPHAATPPAGQPAATSWAPPASARPWMLDAVAPQGVPRPLPLSDQPQLVGERRAHYIHATTNIADLIGSHQSKVRVTFLSGPTGARLLHLKGLTCFVAHLGGRPSPAVQLEHACDIALVTPRAQEIGYIRVATGTPRLGQAVFPVGAELVAVSVDDCMDAILFDFGPGSDAYFVYTQGRPIPRSRRG